MYRQLDPRKIIPFILIFVIGLAYLFSISSPRNYPTGAIVSVREGAGLYEVSIDLKEKNIIRSSFWFRTSAIMLGGERGLKAGDYFLAKKENTFKIAWRIVRGVRNIQTFKITIPEGYTKKEISDLFDTRFPKFDKSAFLNMAQEGYLFPDTYFMEVSTTASSTINRLSDNFDSKLANYEEEIASSTRTLDEIINMASILEAEAQSPEDRKIVAGILWKRLDIGMPLQVDASLKYVTGKGTSELTKEDLTSDSPYNSYLYRGLPPTPISNPGLISIESALRPEESEYLYFLTDDSGQMHYSKNFDQHKKNKELYISN